MLDPVLRVGKRVAKLGDGPELIASGMIWEYESHVLVFGLRLHDSQHGDDRPRADQLAPRAECVIPSHSRDRLEARRETLGTDRSQAETPRYSKSRRHPLSSNGF